MAKNIVICCDGTGNEVDANLSNVLKLFQIARKTEGQCVYYDPARCRTDVCRPHWCR